LYVKGGEDWPWGLYVKGGEDWPWGLYVKGGEDWPWGLYVKGGEDWLVIPGATVRLFMGFIGEWKVKIYLTGGLSVVGNNHARKISGHVF
jgi:hypothetical protein